jgi:hypothetical protein
MVGSGTGTVADSIGGRVSVAVGRVVPVASGVWLSVPVLVGADVAVSVAVGEGPISVAVSMAVGVGEGVGSEA